MDCIKRRKWKSNSSANHPVEITSSPKSSDLVPSEQSLELWYLNSNRWMKRISTSNPLTTCTGFCRSNVLVISKMLHVMRVSFALVTLQILWWSVLGILVASTSKNPAESWVTINPGPGPKSTTGRERCSKPLRCGLTI
jgi:hypothetical protein